MRNFFHIVFEKKFEVCDEYIHRAGESILSGFWGLNVHKAGSDDRSIKSIELN